ncbi:MAG: hypothetical protein NZZ41_05260 [Candidatus Dojkabacteria bacterium]|nr:hypothetical protein [Candidatus Dojkabacteria bacterium]
MNIEDYVAGQGEILPPRARACGTPEQVAHNPRKYATSGCWPEEAIKALVVAYRTYALFYTKNGRSICTNVNCQVYNPNYDSRWAVDETRGEVITYNGNLIEAVYSAENNQGFGTANNETVFQSFSGDGNPFPYLRSVNDNDVSTKGPYHNWTYKTKAYSLEDIRNLLMFVANNPSKFGSISTYISSFDLSNTNYRYMSLERDPSLRVSKVKLFTTDGRIHVIGGYWFKYIWNIYVYENNIRNESGRYDYIYSQTYFIHKL